MKKIYQRPAMEVVVMDMQQQILAASAGSGLYTDGSGSIDSEDDFGTRHKGSIWESELWSEQNGK